MQEVAVLPRPHLAFAGIRMKPCKTMIEQMKKLVRYSAATLILVTASAIAQDWSSCASDLGDLRRRADDATSAAKDADDSQGLVRPLEDALRQCAQYPQVYDPFRDGCRSKRIELDSARTRYRSQLETLKSALEDVDSKVRSVSSSCGYDFARVLGPLPTVPAGVQRPAQCAVYLRYKGRLPASALLETCSKLLPMDECRKCLE